MGLTAEAVANKYNISREAADEFAFASHQKAAHAIQNGYFKDQRTVEVPEVWVENNKRKESQNR
ncbi:MAG: hypothetical protein R2769_05490 [Saprospiraceae bacterium]